MSEPVGVIDPQLAEVFRRPAFHDFGQPVSTDAVRGLGIEVKQVHQTTVEPGDIRREYTAQGAATAEVGSANWVTVPFRDAFFSVPGLDDWPLEALEMAEANKSISMIKTLLGQQQYQAFADLKPVYKDIRDLANAIMKAVGTEPGE